MYNKSINGYINRQRGANFEELINYSCVYYKNNNIAHIEKTPEPMRIIRPFNPERTLFVAAFSKSAQADYKGIMSDGRHVHFEAKSTASDRINQNVLSDKQADDLATTNKFGGVCFVLVAMNSYNQFFRVPWNIWRDMKTLFGHKYMSISELMPYEIKIQLFGLDFLP